MSTIFLHQIISSKLLLKDKINFNSGLKLEPTPTLFLFLNKNICFRLNFKITNFLKNTKSNSKNFVLHYNSASST